MFGRVFVTSRSRKQCFVWIFGSARSVYTALVAPVLRKVAFEVKKQQVAVAMTLLIPVET